MEVPNEYSLEFLPMALNDITEIVSSFLMFENKQGAIRIKEHILKAAEQIQLFPYSGIVIQDEIFAKIDFRVIVVEKYLLFYKIFEVEKKVTVYRILNGKRDFATMIKMLTKQ